MSETQFRSLSLAHASPLFFPSSSTDQVNAAVEGLLGFMAENYCIETHGEAYPTPPHLLIGHTSDLFSTREKFCRSLTDVNGAARWKEYEKTIQDALRECERVIGPLFEKHFGMHAPHPGDFPSQ